MVVRDSLPITESVDHTGEDTVEDTEDGEGDGEDGTHGTGDSGTQEVSHIDGDMDADTEVDMEVGTVAPTDGSDIEDATKPEGRGDWIRTPLLRISRQGNVGFHRRYILGK